MPDPGRKDWPWSEDRRSNDPSDWLPKDLLPGDHVALKCPRITVVIPSFNQAGFLEEAIRSVLLQDYPNLELIIIDGGSSDGSIGIIQRYGSSITHWVSETDRGQCHAINKGFTRASGDIFCWLNSDDSFEPGALKVVASYFIAHPEWQALAGSCFFIDEHSSYLNATSREPVVGDRPTQSVRRTPRTKGSDTLTHWYRDWFPQSSTFWRCDLWQQVGGLNEHLHYSMDYDLWRRMATHAEIQIVPEVLSNYRFQQNAKCMLNQWGPSHEVLAINSLQMTDAEFRSYAHDMLAFLLQQLDRQDQRCAYAQQLNDCLLQSRRYRLGNALLAPFAALGKRLIGEA